MPLTEANHNERISLTRNQLRTIYLMVSHDQIFDIYDGERIGHIVVVYRIPNSFNAGMWIERKTIHISPSGTVIEEKTEDL